MSNSTIDTIRSLRSIHGKFSNKKIPEETIDLILELSTRSANASARQSYSIIVIDDQALMKDICTYSGSHLFIFCVDFTRITDTAKYVSCKFDNNDIIGFITGSIDTIMSAQTSVIAAKSLGIDSLITNGIHRKDLNYVYKRLNLPEDSCFPLIAIVFGYSNENEHRKKGRLSTQFLVHKGTYKRLSNEDMEKVVKEYDDHEKSIGLIDNWDELGFKHYLEWFYKKWTGEPDGKKLIEGKIKEFQDRIIKSGFWYL